MLFFVAVSSGHHCKFIFGRLLLSASVFLLDFSVDCKYVCLSSFCLLLFSIMTLLCPFLLICLFANPVCLCCVDSYVCNFFVILFLYLSFVNMSAFLLMTVCFHIFCRCFYFHLFICLFLLFCRSIFPLVSISLFSSHYLFFSLSIYLTNTCLISVIQKKKIRKIENWAVTEFLHIVNDPSRISETSKYIADGATRKLGYM